MSNFGYDILKHGEQDRDSLLKTGIDFGFYATPAELHHPNGLNLYTKLRTEMQAVMSSCVGHGCSTACEGVAILQSGGDRSKVPELSRYFAYVEGQRAWGHVGVDNGCTIEAGVRSLEINGCPPESVCPYPKQYGGIQITQAMRDVAAKYKLKSHTPMRSEQDCINFLDAGFGSIVIGVLWTRRMAACRGVLTLDDVKEDGSNSGHCMSLVDFTVVDGEIWLIDANSHDVTWGKNGFARISLPAVAYLLKRGYTTMTGISDFAKNMFPEYRVLPSFTGVQW